MEQMILETEWFMDRVVSKASPLGGREHEVSVAADHGFGSKHTGNETNP